MEEGAGPSTSSGSPDHTYLLPHCEKKDTNIRVRRAHFLKATLSTIASSHLSPAPFFKDRFVAVGGGGAGLTYIQRKSLFLRSSSMSFDRYI